jgi:hypothetical protein
MKCTNYPAAIFFAALCFAFTGCDTPLAVEETENVKPPDTLPAVFTVPKAEVTAGNAAELAGFVRAGYTYIGYNGDADAVFSMPDGDYSLIFNDGSVTTETSIDAPGVTIYTCGDLYIPASQSVKAANLCVSGNLNVAGNLQCSGFVFCKGDVDYSGTGLACFSVGINGTLRTSADFVTVARLEIAGYFNVNNNISAKSIYALGKVSIDGGKVLTATASGITIDDDLAIHTNDVQGGGIVSADGELTVNGNIYIDGQSGEKIKNATLPATVTVGKKDLTQMSAVYEQLNKASGFTKLRLDINGENRNAVLSETLIVPEGANIVIRNGAEYRRGLTVTENGTFIISGLSTSLLFETDVSVSGRLTVAQGGMVRLGSERTLDIIGGGELSVYDNLPTPGNGINVTGAVLRTGAAGSPLIVLDGTGVGINLFYFSGTEYGEIELKNSGAVSIAGSGSVNLYGGLAASDKNISLSGSGAVYRAESTESNVVLSASGAGGLITIPSGVGTGAVFMANGNAAIDLGAEHTAGDGIALGSVDTEGTSSAKGVLRLLNGAFIGSASTPIITASGGSISQLGTSEPVEGTDFSAAGTFVQSGYNTAAGVDIQTYLSLDGYGTISVDIDVEP